MRKSQNRTLKDALVVIVDGETEKWYVEDIKKHTSNRSMKEMSIKPDIPQYKSVEKLFDYAKEKTEKGYNEVVLILDADTILSSTDECKKFKVYFENYRAVRGGKQRRRYVWMSKLRLIVNNPCLEFWYLLHFCDTQKFYANYKDIEVDLQKHLKGYDKSRQYYKDIFFKLNGEEGLAEARKHARPFDIEEALSKGTSEMNKLFDLFEEMDRRREKQR